MSDPTLAEEFAETNDLLAELVAAVNEESRALGRRADLLSRYSKFTAGLIVAVIMILGYNIWNTAQSRAERREQFQQSTQRQEQILQAYADSQAQLAGAAAEQQAYNQVSGLCAARAGGSLPAYKSCILSFHIPLSDPIKKAK